jgi:hypothetical protein
MDLRTEFKFTLPRGYLDKEGVLHREGTMRLATAADEIVPLQDTRVRRNHSYFAVLLLSSVITQLGTLEGWQLGPCVVEKLFASDLAFLQDFYRRINQAGSPGIATCCPTCGAQFQVEPGPPESPAGPAVAS